MIVFEPTLKVLLSLYLLNLDVLDVGSVTRPFIINLQKYQILPAIKSFVGSKTGVYMEHTRLRLRFSVSWTTLGKYWERFTNLRGIFYYLHCLSMWCWNRWNPPALPWDLEPEETDPLYDSSFWSNARSRHRLSQHCLEQDQESKRTRVSPSSCRIWTRVKVRRWKRHPWLCLYRLSWIPLIHPTWTSRPSSRKCRIIFESQGSFLGCKPVCWLLARGLRLPCHPKKLLKRARASSYRKVSLWFVLRDPVFGEWKLERVW